MRNFFLLLALILCSYTLLRSQNSPQIDWQFGALGDKLGEAVLIAQDVDNNGLLDIISSGLHYHSYYITLLEYNSTISDYTLKRISSAIPSEILSSQLYDFDKDGIKELYIGLIDGRIIKYNSSTLEIEEIINILYKEEFSDSFRKNNITTIEFGDADNNSSIDLVALTSDTTYILNDNLEIVQKIPRGGTYIKIGNIDNDIETEMIYSNGKIVEVKEKEVKEEYSFYTNYNRTQIELANMNEDEILDLVYSSEDSIYVYDFSANQLIWSNKWESEYDRFVDKIWLYDYDQDNIKDVFLADGLLDALYCYNGLTGQKYFYITDFQSSGITNILVGDFDKDSELEILWSSGAESSTSDFFFIYDITTKEKEWQSKNYIGSLNTFDVGDYNNDGKLELVSGALGMYTAIREFMILNIFDADTKQRIWQNNEAITSNVVQDFSKISIGDVDDDGNNELLVGIDTGDRRLSSVYIFDSLYNIERSFEIDGMSTVIDMNITDIDEDGTTELIVTCGTDVVASSSPERWKNYIFIFDGKTGDLEWKSEQLGGIGSSIGALHVGNIDEDTANEIIALKKAHPWESESGRDTNMLLVIDGISHELIMDQSRVLSVIELADINSDGKDEILAAVGEGVIEILDGASLETIETIHTSCGVINGLKAYDMNGDGILELVITDSYTVNLFDVHNNTLKWRSDTLNSSVGIYNSLFVGDIDSDPEIEIIVGTNIGLYSFEANYETITSLAHHDNIENQFIKVYPNPFKDNITFDFADEINKSITVLIYDINGRRIKEQQFDTINSSVELNVSDLEAGIYFTVILNNNLLILSKIITKIE